MNANTINGLSLTLVGPATNQDVISMNWGDGSALQEQSLTFSHIYISGTYSANLLVIDTGAVHGGALTGVLLEGGKHTFYQYKSGIDWMARTYNWKHISICFCKHEKFI